MTASQSYTLSLHDALPISVMLGQPFYMLMPQVVGVRLTGALRDGVTATDLTLTLTQMLRKRGVVDKRSEEHTSELQSRRDLVCRLLLEKKKPSFASAYSA